MALQWPQEIAKIAKAGSKKERLSQPEAGSRKTLGPRVLRIQATMIFQFARGQRTFFGTRPVSVRSVMTNREAHERGGFRVCSKKNSDFAGGCLAVWLGA